MVAPTMWKLCFQDLTGQCLLISLVCLKRANMYVKLMMLGNPDFGNVGDDC